VSDPKSDGCQTQSQWSTQGAATSTIFAQDVFAIPFGRTA
jgi:hypothetical protein